MNKILPVLLFVLVLLFSSKKAYAYIDPGTGSLFIQILIGCLIGGIYAARNFLKRIFRKFFKKD